VRSTVGSVAAKPQKAAKAGAVVERIGQAHVGKIVPRRQKQRAEQRHRRPAGFALCRSLPDLPTRHVRLHHDPADIESARIVSAQAIRAQIS
jgi:hypothetical protein